MEKRIFTDMLGQQISISYPPVRIISLVPSQTELLYYLGLDHEVIGITKFCVHPNTWFRTKKRVGGTKTINIAAIKELQPDLIIANKEENTKEQIEELSKQFPVWVSNITTIEEALEMISHIGAITAKRETAQNLVLKIKQGFDALEKQQPNRVAYFIWKNPWMCAGGDTFISHLIARMGWINVLHQRSRYPEIILTELAKNEVDIVLLSSEPYPFKEKDIVEIRLALPNTAVWLVDGEMFSWYGSRLLPAIEYLEKLIKKANSKQ